MQKQFFLLTNFCKYFILKDFGSRILMQIQVKWISKVQNNDFNTS